MDIRNNVFTNFITQVSGGEKLQKQSKNFKDLSDGIYKPVTNMGKLQEKAAELGVSTKGLKDHMQQNNIALDKSGTFYNKLNQAELNTTNVQKGLTRSSRRFNMEMLGTLFFGMAVARMFKSLQGQAREASGAMAMWTAMTTLMGLPAWLDIQEAIGKAFDVWSKFEKDHPTGARIVSWSLVVGEALGSATSWASQLGLGVASWSLVWGKHGASIGAWFSKYFGWFAVFMGWLKTGVLWLKNLAGGWNPLIIIVTELFVLFRLLTKYWDDFMAGLQLIKEGNFWKTFIGGAKEAGGVMGTLSEFGKILGSAFTNKKWEFKAEGENTGGYSASFARGGIVTRPTRALIGEAGPEAIIPLSGSNASSLGNNLTYAPSINITANITKEYDVRDIATQINEALYVELRRMGR